MWKNKIKIPFIIEFFLDHADRKTWGVMALLFLSGLLEGLGVVAILPVVAIIAGKGTDGSESIGWVASSFESFGIPFELGPLLLIMVIAITLKTVFRIIAMIEVADISNRVGLQIRSRLMENLGNASWAYFVRQPMGQLANTVSIEANYGSAGFSGVLRFISTVFLVVVYLALALVVIWQITFAALIFGSLITYLTRFLIIRIQQAAESQKSGLKFLVGNLTDIFGNFKPFKAMGTHSVIPNLKALAMDVRVGQRQEAVASVVLAHLYEPLIAIAMAAGMYVAVTYWKISIAELIFAAALFQRTMNYVALLNNSYKAIAKSTPFIRNILDVTREAGRHGEEWNGQKKVDLKRSIVLEKVSFSYPGKQVLDRLSMEIRAGEMTAFFGPSGSGKTTCVDLVCGLHKAQSGRILIDGVPLETISLDHWRSQIGYVPQDTTLLNATILKNVTLAADNVDRAQVIEALKLSTAWDFVKDMEGQLEASVGERGMALSGGQRQKIAIARALYRKPLLLILDEVSSALDPESEVEVCKILAGLKGKMTMLAISHRPAIAEIADHVKTFEPFSQADVAHSRKKTH